MCIIEGYLIQAEGHLLDGHRQWSQLCRVHLAHVDALKGYSTRTLVEPGHHSLIVDVHLKEEDRRVKISFDLLAVQLLAHLLRQIDKVLKACGPVVQQHLED